MSKMPEKINAWEGDVCEFGYRNGSWTDVSMDDTEQYHNTQQLIEWLEGKKHFISKDDDVTQRYAISSYNSALEEVIAKLRGKDE